jgi:hypothetical protein
MNSPDIPGSAWDTRARNRTQRLARAASLTCGRNVDPAIVEAIAFKGDIVTAQVNEILDTPPRANLHQSGRRKFDQPLTQRRAQHTEGNRRFLFFEARTWRARAGDEAFLHIFAQLPGAPGGLTCAFQKATLGKPYKSVDFVFTQVILVYTS